jgi:hypothetical protein
MLEGFEVLKAVVMKSTVLRDITQCGQLKINRRFCLPPAFTLVSCSAYSLTLKIEPICSSEISVDFQQIILLYIHFGFQLHLELSSKFW